MQNSSLPSVRDSTLKLIYDAVTSDRDPSTLDRDTIHLIAIGLQDPLARDRAMALIYPGEIAPALALWNHAVRVCDERGHRMYTAPLHTLRSWAYWTSGDHLNACRAVHSALAVDPTYKLAVMFHLALALDEEVPACLMRTAIEERRLHPEGRD